MIEKIDEKRYRDYFSGSDPGKIRCFNFNLIVHPDSPVFAATTHLPKPSK